MVLQMYTRATAQKLDKRTKEENKKCFKILLKKKKPPDGTSGLH